MKTRIIVFIILFGFIQSYSQTKIPKIYSNIKTDEDGKLYLKFAGIKFYSEKENETDYKYAELLGNPQASKKGINFNFGKKINGKLYFGLIDYENSKYPMPVWFKKVSKIIDGKAFVNIKEKLSGRYDMTDWEKKGYGTLSYRVADNEGNLLYDGIVSFKYQKKHFEIIETITEGPFVNMITPKSVVISFDTDRECIASVIAGGKEFSDKKKTKKHEIKITGLKPDTRYEYEVKYGILSQKYSFKTAPENGTEKPFVFAYASDSRSGQGGGEHNLYGTNFYMMRKMSALAKEKNIAFMQFTGDLVNGYVSDKEVINLQYANWKRAVEPFAHYFPIIATVGNHEFNGISFFKKNKNNKKKRVGSIMKFPFDTESAAAVFAKQFVNPENGPVSEDGSKYDPDPNKTDFPPYKETVFYYVYDNVAVIVLNSDYWYCPSLKHNHKTSGNLHGYIMDNQLKWLEKTVTKLEKDKNIDHIFVTQHTPVFPDGGHTKDDMWYNGKNKYRPYIAGNPTDKGILERRDEYLDILINKSSKTVAILTGDEHNYNKVKISPEVNIYPEKYEFKKLERKRTIWQINNGAAGAPYYAQDKSVPWTDAVSGFTTQNALVLFYVNGKKIKVKVYNPETLDIIDEYILRD